MSTEEDGVSLTTEKKVAESGSNGSPAKEAAKKGSKKRAKKRASKRPPSKSKDKKQTIVSSEALPRRTLKEALRHAQIIRDEYASQPTSWEEIADALGVSSKNPVNRYPLWSAVAYGLVTRQDDNRYQLAETARKILAPTYEGEKEEGIKKALFTPSVLSRFYTDYNGSPLPTDDLFPNVMETRYGIPRERTEEAIQIIVGNAKYAGAIHTTPGGRPTLSFDDAAFEIPSHPSPDLDNGDSPTETVETINQAETTEDWEKICFVITPIGNDDSMERKHADAMLRHLLDPVLHDVGLRAVRADKIAKPGIITKQIIEYLAYSKLCIADLSFSNPNAFYELGVRHALKLSAIQIIKKGDKIPFDVSQGSTIIIDTSDPYTIMDRVEAARNELREHVNAALSDDNKQDDNPVHVFLPRLKVAVTK